MSSSKPTRAVSLVLVLVLALAGAPGLAAAETRAGSTVTIGPNQTVDGLDVMAATVVVHGTVDGDLSGVAADVRISETGVVTGDVNVAAASLEIDGEVRGSVSAGVATFTLGDGASIGGDVDLGAADATFAGRVAGDVTVGADTLVLADTAVLDGGLRYDGDLTRANGASVAGGVVRDESLGGNQFEFSPIPDGAGAVYGLLANFVLGAVLLVAFPGTSRAIASTVTDEPVRAGVVGLVGLVAIPIALVLVALTIVGIPLSIMAAFAFGFVAWAAVVYGWYAVGVWALSRTDAESDWIALGVGLVVATAIGFVPILGGVATFVVLLLGLGALVLVLDDYRRKYRNPRRGTAAGTDAPTA